MYFSSKNGFKILKYIAEGNTFIVNYQLSIVNFYRANGAINRNLPVWWHRVVALHQTKALKCHSLWHFLQM